MVTTIDIYESAVIRLTATELMLGDLPEVTAEWGELPEGERAAWSIE